MSKATTAAADAAAKKDATADKTPKEVNIQVLAQMIDNIVKDYHKHMMSAFNFENFSWLCQLFHHALIAVVAGGHKLVVNGMPVTRFEVIDVSSRINENLAHSSNKVTGVDPEGKEHAFNVDLSLGQFAPFVASGKKATKIGEVVKDPATGGNKAGATPVETVCRLHKFVGLDKKTGKPKFVPVVLEDGDKAPGILPVPQVTLSGDDAAANVAKCRSLAEAYADFLMNGLRAGKPQHDCLISKRTLPRKYFDGFYIANQITGVRPADVCITSYTKTRGKYCDFLPKIENFPPPTIAGAAPAAIAE